MDRKRKIKNLTQEVKEIQEDVAEAIQESPLRTKENTMDNSETVTTQPSDEAVAQQTVPVAEPAVVEQPVPADEVEVVVQRDGEAQRAQATQDRQNEEQASLSQTDDLRGRSIEELLAAGVPASSIPHNTPNSQPDFDPEKAAEGLRRAAASESKSYVFGEDDSDENRDGEIVG